MTLFRRLFFQPYSCDDLGVVQGYPAALHTGPNHPRLAEGARGDCTEVTAISSAKPDHNDLALSQSYCRKPNTTFTDQQCSEIDLAVNVGSVWRFEACLH